MFKHCGSFYEAAYETFFCFQHGISMSAVANWPLGFSAHHPSMFQKRTLVAYTLLLIILALSSVAAIPPGRQVSKPIDIPSNFDRDDAGTCRVNQDLRNAMLDKNPNSV
jgi:hypothetical protein